MDKSKTCYRCPDRHIGCHATCKFYLKRKAENDKRREVIKRENNYGFIDKRKWQL